MYKSLGELKEKYQNHMLEIVWKIMLGIYIMILFYLTLAGRKQVDPLINVVLCQDLVQVKMRFSSS